MENFDLNELGVSEISISEKLETDGGFFWILGLIVTYVVVEACCNPQAHINAWNQGWDRAEAERQ